MIYPLKFKPLFFEKPWGGEYVQKVLGYDHLSKIGEIWLLSSVNEKQSCVLNGPLEGFKLDELMNNSYLGIFEKSQHTRSFPVLIKILDAADNLSVQVHPGAYDYDITSKEEMWYILKSQPGSTIACGLFKKFSDKYELVQHLAENKIYKQLKYIDVKEGDVIYIPPGTVHFIGKGITLLEIQQSCDVTYRLYDWDRLDNNGGKRKLHISEALNSIFIDERAGVVRSIFLEQNQHVSIELLLCSKNFSVIKLILNGVYELDDFLKTNYLWLTLIKGYGELYSKGEFYSLNYLEGTFKPASLRELQIAGAGEFIIVTYLEPNFVIQRLMKRGYTLANIKETVLTKETSLVNKNKVG